MRLRRFATVPWFLPGLVLSIVVGYLVRRRVARWLGVSPVIGWCLVVAVGAILAATLTPLHELRPGDTVPVAGCDLSRMGFAPLDDLLSITDTSLNVVLFVPLGLTVALCPRSRRKALVLAGAIALPFVIEGTQLVATFLERGCQSADVIDNLTGLAIGLAIGSLAGAVWPQRRVEPDDGMGSR